VHDLHGAAAQNEGWTDQHRNRSFDDDGFMFMVAVPPVSAWDLTCRAWRKMASIFGHLDAGGLGADNRAAIRGKEAAVEELPPNWTITASACSRS
jgi:hypothetical protein